MATPLLSRRSVFDVDDPAIEAVDPRGSASIRSPGTGLLGEIDVTSGRAELIPVRRGRGEAASVAVPIDADDEIAILRSDEERFTDLVRRHHRRFAHLAFMLCGDREQAEDAVADAYARVWPRFRRGTVDDPVAYLRGAVVNQVRGRFRRLVLERREDARHVVDWRDGVRPEASVDDRSLLGPALLRLPETQRTVLVLRFLEDVSEEDTAALLGVRPGTVKSRCARGLEQLRRLIDDPSRDG